jgi:uncharacterized protein (TIGR02147 family)
MPDIFTYTDFRLFLADYYRDHKERNPSFSYQILADKAGFPNRGFIYNVIKGSKNFSPSSAVKVAQALQLDAKEADYFENLVSFNQAKSLRERNYFFAKMSTMRSNRQGGALLRETRREHYDFYASWYIGAIRALIDMHPFKDDYKALARQLFPPIKPKEAQRAVAILENLGMIRRKSDGYYTVADKTIKAGKEIVQLGLQNFQLQTMDLAKKALQELPKDKRHISGLMLGISGKTYEAICRELEEFQSKLLQLAEADDEADCVYQVNFHLFPISKTKTEE